MDNSHGQETSLTAQLHCPIRHSEITDVASIEQRGQRSLTWFMLSNVSSLFLQLCKRVMNIIHVHNDKYYIDMREVRQVRYSIILELIYMFVTLMFETSQ
jgi:hypothetical protein